MKQYKISQKLLNHFGLKNGMGFYATAIVDDRKDFIKDAIKEQQMLAIVGDVGVGKSTLFEIVKGEMKTDTTFIYAADPMKEYMQIGTLLSTIIRELSDEAPRHSRAARQIQFTKIVGSQHISYKRNICLVIEEAHRLNMNMFRAIKELREAEYLDTSPIFSVVLIGHAALNHKLGTMKEAGLRTHYLYLDEMNGWLNINERINFLIDIFGRAIKPTVKRRIAALYHTPLEMVNFVEEKMTEAYKAGKNNIDDEVVKPTPRELYDAVKESHPGKISYKVIADEINCIGKEYLGRTTVSDIINKGGNKKQTDLVKKAIEKIADKQTPKFISKTGTHA